jgi:hypothetical protein
MGVPGSANLMLFGGAQAYEIDQSLRFDTDQYLQRTNGSAATDGQYGTLSVWFKLANSTDLQTIIEGSNSTYGHFFRLTTGFKTDLHIGVWGSVDGGAESNAVFRDNSAWYHFLWQFDKTQSGVTNVNKLWVNGVSIAQTAAGTFSSQNWGVTNNGSTTVIGNYKANGSTRYGHLKSYMAEMHVIDGSLKAATDFGETDPDTGAWIPKRYSGTYGTNGFYLKFDPAATNGIGHDHSGNGNNFTATGFTTSGTGTDVMSDTPTTNWATIIANNPTYGYQSTTIADGNLQATFYPNAATGNPSAPALSSITVPASGKWYYEFTTAGSNNYAFGIAANNSGNLYNFTLSRAFWGWYHLYQAGYPSNGDGSSIYGGASGSASGGGFINVGDIIGVEIDIPSGSIVFKKNGSSYASITSCNFSSYTEFVIQWGTATNGISGSSIIANFGQRAFAYTPPTGYKALNTANLPEPTIKDGGKYFDTKLYTGSGGSQSLTGLGFQPELVWIKARSTASSHGLYDAVRGVGKVLLSNSTSAEQNYGSYGVTSFDATGFSVNDLPGYGVNDSGVTYAAWCWDAGGTGSSNNAGTITSTVSANASAGFSIVTYTGTGSNASVGHGLGVTPSMCIIKQRNTAQSWWVWHQALGNNVGANNTMLELNGTAGTYAADDVFRGFTSTVFNIGTDSGSNTNGGTYVAYCFSEVAGYSKFGSYTGNGSSDGPFVFTGFKVAWLMWKRTDSTANWFLMDAARNTYNVVDKEIYPDRPDAENTFTDVDFLSNGFKLRASAADRNASGGTFVYAAFAELPFKYSTAR